MDERRPVTAPRLPWSSDLSVLVAEARVCEDGAGCSFVIDDEIPQAARAGFAALVVAHTRDGEPVTLFDDGSALLLIRTGGVSSARIAAERIVAAMRRLGLETTLRVGIAGIDGDADGLADRARGIAKRADAGAIAGA